jgi:hypothetical protein
MSATDTPVVERTIDLRCSADHAFTMFTARMTDWWPLATHSFGAGMDDHEAVACVLEPHVGGRLYEVLDDGRAFDWGRVVVFAPGELVAFDWNPSLERRPYTRVEVRFTATGRDSCRVELTHRGFEAWAQPSAARDSYDEGWGHSLALFGAVAESSSST